MLLASALIRKRVAIFLIECLRDIFSSGQIFFKILEAVISPETVPEERRRFLMKLLQN
jgi:hypothetical protein